VPIVRVAKFGRDTARRRAPWLSVRLSSDYARGFVVLADVDASECVDARWWTLITGRSL
jgi:hypothetical protein